MSEQSFTTMAGAKAAGEAPEIGVGMLGYAFMGKAHTNAYKKLPYMMYPPVAIPQLVAIAGRNEEAVEEAAQRYGYEKYYTDWRKMLEDDRSPAVRQRRPQRHARRAVRSRPRRRASTSSARSRWPAPPKKPKPMWTRSRRPASSTWSPSTTASCRPSAWPTT